MQHAAPKSLIPRAMLFGNPTRAQAQLSPDGTWLSWLAPKDGVLNIWVAPFDDMNAAQVISDDRKRGIRFHGWAPNGTHVLYFQDEGGDEDFHTFAVEVASREVRNLTPIKGVQAQMHGFSLDFPDSIAVGLNERDKSWHDLFLIDIRSGKRELLFENKDELSRIVLDRQFKPRLASKTRAKEGGRTRYRIEDGKLIEIGVVGHEDDLTTYTIGYTRDGATLYTVSSIGRDKAALFATDVASGKQRLLAEHGKADVGHVLAHPETGVIDAAGAVYLHLDWIPLEEAMAADLKILHGELPGEVGIADRTLDDKLWIVTASAAETPTTYHVYDRSKKSLRELFSTRPELKSYRLAPMHGEIIRARDGLELPSYLTLPHGKGPRPTAPLPLVLVVHGGPWARDAYGFDAEAQWLADRGFAVLSVNFRASTGFGKAFINAGDLQWGRKMHDDLLDAVEWAVANGIARRDRIAIMGGSYGGYATLAGLTFTPEVFCCGVDIVGPSNLETLLATIPPYWAAFYETLCRRVGDPRTEAGKKLLWERSPLNFAGNITKPLLIGQGANDPRVKQAESDQIIQAMRAKDLSVTYVLYPEEGHGFAVPENRLSFQAITEAFLVANLGGEAEPIGKDFQGAKLEVPEGASHVQGLQAALSARS
ncbi:MAG TPA: S9 family peptidase [Hyphomicrobiaceae bacterium]|nr:S9 family peptidase [Hyphomicrobiaceae bacterium]